MGSRPIPSLRAPFDCPAAAGLARAVTVLPAAAILLASTVLAAPAAAHQMASEDHEPREILVAASDAWILQHASKLGFVPVEAVRLGALRFDVVRLRVPADSDARGALDAFRSAFADVPADLNAAIWPTIDTDEVAVARTGDWPRLRSTCGAGLRIGMIDTPVDASHAAFRGRRMVLRSFISKRKKPATSRHGTAVAALLVGDPDSDGYGGLLPRATLLAGNIFERRSGGRARGNLFALLKALDWLAKSRVQVVNLSFQTGKNVILFKALEKAAGRNLVLTAAAGHLGVGSGPAYPAAHPDVLTATAIGADMRPYRHAIRGPYIDFAAPGVGLWTAVPGGGEVQSGTSFAVPFLSAVAALRLANGLRPDAAQVRRTLARGARDLGAPGRDDVFGWGLIGPGVACS